LAPLMDTQSGALAVNPETHIQWPPKGWKGFPFYFNGIRFRKNLAQFPVLADRLAAIPHLISAGISVLEPGASLLPHNGSTNAVMRVHFPLKVPGRYPDCGMDIEGHEVSWEEGKVFMFCDMKIHRVQNLTRERRYILLMDVMRPEYVHLKKMVCVHTIARILVNVIMNLVKAVLRK
jgi:aspartyl/asparaginyl beta-hydroxylase (cupin superfamily)